MTNQQYYTPMEFAEKYNIPVNTVNAWIYRKVLPAEKPNGRRLIKQEDALAFRANKIKLKEWRWK